VAREGFHDGCRGHYRGTKHTFFDDTLRARDDMGAAHSWQRAVLNAVVHVEVGVRSSGRQ
jgi:hypothetical protein